MKDYRMINRSFEYTSNLEYSLKAAREQIKAFESGEKYVRMSEEHKAITRYYEQQIRQLKKELAEARAATIRIRNMWFTAMEDSEKERDKERKGLERELEKMKSRALKAEAQRDLAYDKISEQRHVIYELATALEEEKGKNQKLTAQLNHDYENSSIPSSMTIKKKKISNSREKTGRKPGGQPGHKGHCRKKQKPTEVIILPPPQEVLNDSDFKKTKRTIIKQVVGISVSINVKEYHADVYYNSKTGERIHAQFPAEAKDDVNYDAALKHSFIF